MLKKAVLLLLNLSVLFIMLYGITVFAQYNIYIHEDASCAVIQKNDLLNQFLLNVYHGRYIGNFLTALEGGVLPFVLKIHPFVFFNAPWGAAGLKALFLFILFYQMSLFLYNKREKNLMQPLIIFSLYVWYQNNFAFRYQDCEYCSFFGFVFPFIFFCLFWFKFIKIFEKNENSVKDTAISCFYAFLTGISTEFTSIVSFFALLIIFAAKKHLFKKFIYTFIFLVCGMIFYFGNKGFSMVLADHAPVFFNFASLKSELVFVKPFLLSCLDVTAHEYCFYLISALFGAVLIFVQNKKEKRSSSNLLIPSAFTAGSIGFTVFLISNPALSPDLNYWVYHFDLIIQYKILFFIVIFYEMNLIKADNWCKNILIAGIIAAMLSFYFTKNENFYRNMFKNGLKNAVNKNPLDYQDRYKYEKINLYYIKNKQALYYIPDRFPGFLPHTEINYFEWYYNLDKDAVQNIINIENIEELQRQYLKDGGIDFTEDELNEINFQTLIKYRNK